MIFLIAFSFNFFTRLRQEFILREEGCYIETPENTTSATSANNVPLYIINDEFVINQNYIPDRLVSSSSSNAT